MCPGCGQARLDVVKRFVFICMCLVPFQWGSPAPAQTGGEAGEDCDPHGLEPGPVKERIQRWSGLKPFSNWRIRATDLAACARDGVVLLHLQIAPPAKWSVHDLPYRVWLTIPLDGASGQPMEAPPEAFASLAAGVKRMTARAERYEDVRRFIERFGVGRAEIDKTAETGCFRVTYVAEVQPGQKGPRVPSITYDESARDRITTYRIPRMDSLPVRREMLRMLEVLSSQHPQCRPCWIDANRHELPGPEVQPIRWTFQLDLEGPGCPPTYAAKLEPDGVVARVGDSGSATSSKGDASAAEGAAPAAEGDGGDDR